MAAIKAGDRVRLVDRAAKPQDQKSGLYYNHFRGLEGVVQKVFQGGEVAVEIGQESLPHEVGARHGEVRQQMRDRWLQGLPDDQRRKLTPEQKQLNLRYVVLTGVADLQKLRRRD